MNYLKDTAVLLINVGTPDSPTLPAVKQYLEEFLSDNYVVRLPKWIWQPILHGLILRFRPKKSAALYQKIWMPEGSPLFVFSSRIAHALEKKYEVPVVLGMRYGNPSIPKALEKLRNLSVKKIILFPLYPQYSTTTTASALDYVAKSLKQWDTLPEINIIRDYAEDENYIKAVSRSIQRTWEQKSQPQHLLFSFHGIPKSYSETGDPYAERCRLTASLVAQSLQLTDKQWSIAFQSRLGYATWLKPYTYEVLESFPQKGITDLNVICPGFAADCLETLEEIAIRGKERFLQSGGKSFYYIPALNDEHIDALAGILQNKIDLEDD